MNISSAPPIKRRTAIIGWITIFTQAALPLSFAYAPLVHAATAQDANASKWYQSGNNASQDETMFGQSTDTLNGAGAALSQANSSGAAAGMARSAATGAVNNGVEEWLSQFGTARVQLNLDDNFKAEGSQADLLLPLYENKSIIAFTQLGFRHIDSRNTGNLGVGARYFTGDWMLGANTFFDNDFTGENRRIGLGLEAWRDYLKLSANSYIRLSEWHQSRDFADYDERPANGYDLRAEGWLPAFPQLGAKVMYEKYQGDEVALFGKDNRQKDPWAFTGGINYTPIPLVTVGAQHRAGKDGQNDSQLLLEMNYRLGEPWGKQIDPNLVGASRTLSGTRYDLVERNNSIVLDYRKQQTVTLVVPEKTSGKGGSTVPVSFTVKSQHPLQRIDWDAAALVAAGGSLTQTSNSQLSVVLPAYQAGSNVYRFAGVAYDVNGNSGSATGQITVEVGDVSATATKVSAEPATIIADGKSTSTVSISLFDDGGNAIPGMAKSLSATLKETLAANQPASLKGPQAATLGAITEASPGVYQAVVTSGTGVGSILVSPTFNDTALAEVTVTETADNATGHIGSGAFTAVVDNSAANGTAMNQVKATVTDAGGNPLPNTAVTFALSGSATAAAGSSLSATTDDKGQVTLNFVDKVAEAVTVTATLPNGNAGTVDTHFLADGSTATLSDGAVTVDKTTVVANNTDMATFTAVVKDANGNVVPDVTVSWATDKGTLSGSTSTTNAGGVATITLKHNVAEAAQVSAKAGSSASVNAPVVNFTADNASGTIGSGDVTVDKTTVIANNADVATFSAIVKDAGGNLVPNATVNWTSNKDTLSGASSTTDVNGVATITLKDTVVGQAQVVAQTGRSASVNAPAVDFTADTTTATIGSGDLTVDKTEVVADNADVAIFSAKVKDAHGNAVPNATVKWATNKGTLSGSTSSTDANGVATITLKDKLVGQAQVAAQTGTSGSVDAPAVSFVANASTSTIGSGDLTVDKTTVVADNLDVATYTAIVKDANGNLVPGVTVNWSSDKGTLSGASSTTNAGGVATITLKHNLAEAAQVTAKTGSSANVSVPVVNFTADNASATIGSGDLTVDKTTVVANNTDVATFTAIVKDANGNLVPNIRVSWATDLGTLSAVDSSTDETGRATITLKGTLAGTAQVTALVNGSSPTNAPKVSFIADSGSATVGSGDLTVDKTTVIANDADVATFSAKVKDANGNVVPNVAVSWSTNKGTLAGASSSTDANGVATVTLKGTVTGEAQVAAKVGTSASVNAPVVNFIADNASATIGNADLTVDKTIVIANNVDVATYSAVVKDANGNAVPKATVNWSSNKGTLSGNTSTTNADGVATIRLKDTLVGQAQVVAQTGTSASISAPVVNFMADGTSATIGSGDVTADKTQVVADNADMVTYSAVVKDANGNAVPNAPVNWTTNKGTLSGNTSTTNIKGVATITLKDTLVGQAQVAAQTGTSGSVDAPAVSFVANASSATIGSGDLTVDKTTAVADNVDVATYSAVVKDANGNVVPNVTVNWTTNNGTLSGASSSTDTNGKATITLKNTLAGQAQVVAQTGTSSGINAPIVNFTADSSTGAIGSGDLTVDKVIVIANNTDTATYTAIVKDANGNAVPGVDVSWSTDTGTLSGATSTTDSDGKATITLKGTLAGDAQVTASVNGMASTHAPKVTLTADTTSATIGSGGLTVDKNTVVANNADVATYSAVVKDANGNVVPNVTIIWTTNKGTLSGASSTTDANGLASVTLKGTQAGDAQVVAKVGSSASVNAPVVNFTADSASSTIGSGDLTVDKTTVVANNADVATFSAIVKDANGNLVPNATVNWISNKGTLSGDSSSTDANGLATIMLKNTQTGQTQVVAQTGTSSGINAPVVNFTADGATASIGSGDLTVDKTTVVANNADVATYSAVVKDANGNAVPNVAVTWTTNKGTLAGASSSTDANGVATITLKDTVAGDAQVVAKVGSSASVNAPVVNFTADSNSATIGSGDLTVDKTTVVADNLDVATYSAVVKDANGNLVPNVTVNWSTDKGTLSGASATTNASGIATVTLKNTLTGKAQVVAQTGTSSGVNAPQVEFIANGSTGAIGSGDLTVDKVSVIANNADTATFTAVVKDANGNLVPNIKVSWATDLGTLSAADSSTDETGRATITLKGTLAGIAQVTASVNGKAPASAPKVTLTADAASATIGSGDLTVDKTSVVANNADVATYSAIVKDANGNLLSNVAVSWTSNKGTLSGATSSTDANGVATVTLKNSVAEAVQVVAKVGTSVGVNAPVVNFTPDSTTATIGSGGLTVDKTTVVANNTDVATYTAIVKDAGGNAVPNLAVKWATNLGTLSGASSTTDSTGKAIVTLKGTLAGDALVTAAVNGSAPVSANKVTFTADPKTASIGSDGLTVDKTTIVANNVEVATYTALVKDANGNPVPNASVSWTTDNGTLSGASSTTNVSGSTTITLKGKLAAAAQVTAKVNGGASVNAPLVSLIGDVTTAQVTTVTSSLAKMTGTGVESSIQTATVTDANGNILQAQTVNWSTTLGNMSNATSQTDSNGEATSTLSGTVTTGASNATATVTAAATAGSKTANVTVRTVLVAGGKSYWTMMSDHATAVQTTAQGYCATYGGGRLMTESDFNAFVAAKGDFETKSVSGEFGNPWFRFGDKWTTKAGDMSSAGGKVGGTTQAAGTDYVCVK